MTDLDNYWKPFFLLSFQGCLEVQWGGVGWSHTDYRWGDMVPRHNLPRDTCPKTICPEIIRPGDNPPQETICPGDNPPRKQPTPETTCPETICLQDNVPRRQPAPEIICPGRQYAPETIRPGFKIHYWYLTMLGYVSLD